MFSFFKKRKTLIESQLENYISYWQKRYGERSAKNHEYYLNHFLRYLDIKHHSRMLDVELANKEDVEEFKLVLSRTPHHNLYMEAEALKAIRNFQSFTKRAKMEAMRKSQKPVWNKDLDIRIAQLRDTAQLSFREIGRAIDRDVKTVYRRYKRYKDSVGSYPQV